MHSCQTSPSSSLVATKSCAFAWKSFFLRSSSRKFDHFYLVLSKTYLVDQVQSLKIWRKKIYNYLLRKHQNSKDSSLSTILIFLFLVTFTRLKSGYTCPFMLDRVPNCHKTLEMCEKTVFRITSFGKNSIRKYKSRDLSPKVSAITFLLSEEKLVLLLDF